LIIRREPEVISEEASDHDLLQGAVPSL